MKGKVVYLCVNLFLENNYRLLFNDFEMYVNLILMIFSEDVNYICLEFEIEKIYVLKRGLSLWLCDCVILFNFMVVVLSFVYWNFLKESFFCGFLGCFKIVMIIFGNVCYDELLEDMGNCYSFVFW